MKKIWSSIPKPLLRKLSRTPTEDLRSFAEAWCESQRLPTTQVFGHVEEEVYFSAVVSMIGVGRWLKGQRRIIDISDEAMDLMDTWDWRWGELPVPKSSVPDGIMFCFDPTCLIYVEPVAPSEIRYILWMTPDNGKNWATYAPTTEEDPLASLSPLDTQLGSLRPMYAVDPQNGVQFELEYEPLLRVCVNTLAAINADPKVLYAGKRKAPRRRGMGAKIRNIKKYRLTIDGARTVTKRWETEKNQRKTEITRTGHTKGLHVVQPHYWRVWVNNPKPDEEVLEVRTKQRTVKGQAVTYRQYRVRRWRKGEGKDGLITRGRGELKARTSRVVTGVHDI